MGSSYFSQSFKKEKKKQVLTLVQITLIQWMGAKEAEAFAICYKSNEDEELSVSSSLQSGDQFCT